MPRRLRVLATTTAAVSLALGAASAHGDTRTCLKRSYEDLRATNVSCTVAGEVYRRSLRVSTANDSDPTPSFRHRGILWRCRAVDQTPYTFRCTASRSRAMTYRFLAGE